MEATHFGAWFSNRSEEDLNNGIEIVSKNPDYREKI